MNLSGPKLAEAKALLAHKIATEGRVIDNNILLVDRFLNQQLDISLFEKLGQAFAEVFADAGVTKVMTIEASGIALAFATAQAMGLPAVFVKKHAPLNLGKNYYESRAFSYTKQQEFPLSLSRYLLDSSDRVLIVDDFLARGEALKGLVRLCHQADAKVVGVGIAIEKSFQGGSRSLTEHGIPLCSLHVIERFD